MAPGLPPRLYWPVGLRFPRLNSKLRMGRDSLLAPKLVHEMVPRKLGCSAEEGALGLCLLAGLLPETCCEENLGGVSTSSFLFFLRIRESAVGSGSTSGELSVRFCWGLVCLRNFLRFSLGSV